MINLFTKPIHDTALLLIGDKSSINKIVSHSSCRTKYRARRVNHRTSPLLAFPPRKNLTVATNAKELFSLEKIDDQIDRFLHFLLVSRISLADISGGETREEWGTSFGAEKKSRVRVFTRENDALGARWIDGSIGGGVYRRYKAKSRYGVGYGRTADPETLFGYRQNR